jgi:cellobiose phosphorylase
VRFGRFSEDGREYIIHRPDTPRPWINYLSNEHYCALCSHTGGGYSFFESAGFDRITQEVPSMVVLRDRPGRYVYLRDQETGEYWSVNWQPVCKEPSFWESRHGMGYTQLASCYGDIAGEITYFVPRDDNCEIWMITIANRGNRPRHLRMFAFVQWCLGNYAFQLIESAFSHLFNEVTFEDGIIYAESRFWNVTPPGEPMPNHAWDKCAFMGGDFDVAGFDCSGEDFIGMYRSWNCPEAIEAGACRGSTARGREAVGVLQRDLDIPAGLHRSSIVVVGIADSRRTGRDVVEKYRQEGAALRELHRVRDYWNDYLGRVTVSTPCPDLTLSVNVWNKYQAWVTSRWSRMDSYYIGGGSIVGHRDSWQDTLSVLVMEPEWVRERVQYLLRHQFADGGTLHNWDPRTDLGVRTGHSDDPMWIAHGLSEYLRETGDFALLDEQVPYYDQGEATVYQHLTQAMDYALARLSPRGLPLMLAADWNDGFDQVGREGRGESVMVAEHLCWMLKETAEICRRHGDAERAQRYRAAADKLAKQVNEIAWDGEWYWRATTDDGEVLGSAGCELGKIYLNVQAWAVLSGVAGQERGVQCMDAVWQHLDTKAGPAVFLPAYRNPDRRVGIITRFAPGTKENGTIFNHPVAWAVIAETVLGRGARAYEMWHKNSFLTRGRDPDYRAEPYVYAEYVNGPDSVRYGQGEFTWMTGTAAWMWRACLDYILGLRATYDGLLINPCLPAQWDGFRARRPFRGDVYEVEVTNPDHVETGVREIVIDDEPFEGNLVVPVGDGETHSVRVTMGR